MKKNEQLRQKQQPVVLHLLYSPLSTTTAMTDFKQELNNHLKNSFVDYPRIKDFSIKILQYRSPPLSVNDLLIKTTR